jgi:hypothetical protein
MPSNGECTNQQRLTTTARSLSWSAVKIPLTSMMQNDTGDGDDNCRLPNSQMNDVDADDDGDEQKSGYSRTSRLKEENVEERAGR